MYFHSIIRHSYVSLLSKNWFGLKTRLIDCHPNVNNLNPFEKYASVMTDYNGNHYCAYFSIHYLDHYLHLFDGHLSDVLTKIITRSLWRTKIYLCSLLRIISFLLSLEYGILNYLLCAWVHKEVHDMKAFVILKE